MIAHAGRGRPLPHQVGFFGRITTAVRAILAWRPGRYESIEEDLGPVADFVPLEPEPEHIHHLRFSVQELDACIADSIRSGVADLHAAERHDDELFNRLQSRARSRCGTPPAPAQAEDQAFGGELYPTAAHATDPDARHVRVSTWTNRKQR